MRDRLLVTDINVSLLIFSHRPASFLTMLSLLVPPLTIQLQVHH